MSVFDHSSHLPPAHQCATLPFCSTESCLHGFALRGNEDILQAGQTVHQPFCFPLNFRDILAGQDQALRGLSAKLGNKLEVALFDSPLLTTGSDVSGQRVHDSIPQLLDLLESGTIRNRTT